MDQHDKRACRNVLEMQIPRPTLLLPLTAFAAGRAVLGMTNLTTFAAPIRLAFGSLRAGSKTKVVP